MKRYRSDEAATTAGALTRAITYTLVIALAACALAACGDDSDATPADSGVADTSAPDSAQPDGSSGAALWAVLIRGELSTGNLADAKNLHDTAASGGEQPAKAAGDIGHDALLGTTLLGTTENEFLGIDQWTSPNNIQAFYSNPDFQKAFAPIFKSPPAPEIFEHKAAWHGWGDLAAGDSASKHFFIVVRGRLAESDIAKAKAAHDAIAAAGEAQANAAGDVAHVVFLGVDDPREFFAVDVWTDDTNIASFYSNPDFQKAFGALFESAPSVAVYASTDWHQW